MTDVICGRPSDTPRGLNNCGIVALAAAIGTSHSVVWNAYADRYIDRVGAWKGYTILTCLIAIGEKLGIDVAASMPAGGRWHCTLTTWVREHSLPGVTYIVRTGGHMQCVRDGRVTDQDHDAVPVTKAGRIGRKRVTHVYVVTGTNHQSE